MKLRDIIRERVGIASAGISKELVFAKGYIRTHLYTFNRIKIVPLKAMNSP